MQVVIGYSVLAAVLIFAGFGTVATSKGMRGVRSIPYQMLFNILTFFLIVLGCYTVLGCIGGILWAIAWIGILIRDVLQWLVEAVLYPLLQLVR
jgi:hypothetical protein